MGRRNRSRSDADRSDWRPLSYRAQDDKEGKDNLQFKKDRDLDTESPIKHVIILIGENGTFDNVYGTYVPKHGQYVSNLLSAAAITERSCPSGAALRLEHVFARSTSPALASAQDLGCGPAHDRRYWSEELHG
jgi:hypothetical protein